MSAIAIGCIGSVCAYAAIQLRARTSVDDALDVFACHGVSGIVGALVTVLALRDGLCAGTAQTAAADPALGPVFVHQLHLVSNINDVQLAASHSFGFGGNNCVLVFGRGGA